MKKVDAGDAYRIGWYVSQLMQAGFRIDPVMLDGMYTDTVEWRVEGPDGRFYTVHLTIDPDGPQ